MSSFLRFGDNRSSDFRYVRVFDLCFAVRYLAWAHAYNGWFEVDDFKPA